jgi:ABC-type multidrug transport system fused ATPase/permease subunit
LLTLAAADDRICIHVTHRLTPLLSEYDEIIVMQHGTVAERGTFTDLLAAQGAFYALYLAPTT